jgi:DNA-binding response OmpR family regulator
MCSKIELDVKRKARFNCYASVTRRELEMKTGQDGKPVKARILIIEDQMAVAMMMVYLLNRVGCDVTTAVNGVKGMRMAEDGDFDLITLDVDMPGMDGFEICSRLKKDVRLCHTPIVFVSGRLCDEDVRRGLELGAVDYIIKPFEVTDFIFRVMSHTKRTGNVLEAAC